MSKVVPFGKEPHRLTAEMSIRWLMSMMDQVDDLIIVAKKKGKGPIVSVTTDTSPYMIAMAASLLQDLALDGMEPSSPTPKSRA